MLHELLNSVEDVWAIWLCSVVILSMLVYRSLRSQHWQTLASFFRDESGASYALNYLMTFPAFLITVCWVIQGTMILVVKIGAMHSAHMAARSAVVWRSAQRGSDSDGLNLAKAKARSAAVLAMTPYASGLDTHLDAVARVRSVTAIPLAIAYDELYRNFAQNTPAQNRLAVSAFVQRKLRYASVYTTVDISRHRNRFNEPLSATVRFRMPIHIPGTGRIYGRTNLARTGYYRDIQATATLPLETAETPDGKLGIDYDPTQL